VYRVDAEIELGRYPLFTLPAEQWFENLTVS
jgi:hypothetical protein